jgi:aminoglycoside phosphotransferase (APT) family kinase protein
MTEPKKEVREYKSYKPEHGEEDIRNLVHSCLHQPVSNLERLDAGSINAVYRAVIEDGEEVFVRVSPGERDYDSFDEEAWAYKLCGAEGVPVPQIIAMDTSRTQFGEAYMITHKLPGLPGNSPDISRIDKETALREVGHYLSIIHRIKLPGFGSLVPDGGGFKGKYNTLRESMEVKPNPDYDEEMSGMVEEIQTNLLKHADILNLEQGSLVHSDMASDMKNALIQNGHITGILDMENARITDPIYDFAYFTFFEKPGEGTEKLELVCEGYDDKSLFDENFELKRTLLQLKLAVDLSYYYHGRNDPRQVIRVRSKLRYLLDQLKNNTQ